VLMDLHAAANQGIPAAQAAQVNPVTGTIGPVSPLQTAQGTGLLASLPPTILGMPSGTFLLLAAVAAIVAFRQGH
jgi:hypothetical protein